MGISELSLFKFLTQLSIGNIGNRYKSWNEFNVGHRVHGYVEDEDFVVNDEKKAIALARRKFYNIIAVGKFW